MNDDGRSNFREERPHKTRKDKVDENIKVKKMTHQDVKARDQWRRKTHSRLTPYSTSRRLLKVRGSWFLETTDFCHPQAHQIHRCIFAPVTSVNAHYYSVLTTPFDMVNAHYVIIDFRAKFFIKIQNQASDTSRSLPSFSSAPFLLRAVPSERLGQVYTSR